MKQEFNTKKGDGTPEDKFFAAMEHGSLERVKEMIEQGVVQVKGLNKYGRPVLEVAVDTAETIHEDNDKGAPRRKRYIEIATLLAQAGAEDIDDDVYDFAENREGYDSLYEVLLTRREELEEKHAARYLDVLDAIPGTMGATIEINDHDFYEPPTIDNPPSVK